MPRPHFILASASPHRLQLLQQVRIAPDLVAAADIDETPHKNEPSIAYAKRMARGKADIVAAKHPESLILAADTVVACGKRILPKADDETAAKKCLLLLSGKRHRVYTAVCIAHNGKYMERLVMTQVQFKRLSDIEITHYLASGEWQDKAGGYAIQGLAEAYIARINGSYSNVVGLPLAETLRMLQPAGIRAKA